MPVVVKSDDNSILAADDLMFKAEDIRSNVLIEQTQRLDYDFGTATIKEMRFDGIMMGYGTIDVHENIKVEASDLTPLVGMHFVLKGNYQAQLSPRKEKVTFSDLEHTIMYNPDMEDYIQVRKQPGMSVFGMSFTIEKFKEMAEGNGRLLESYAEKIEANKPIFLLDNYRITQKMLAVINDVKNCEFSGGLKKLFLQSKALELLALQCEQVETTKPSREGLSKQDIEKIHFAKEILLLNAREPLSLTELARKAGINEFKLKKGFKEVFNNTVFGYLSDYRMEQAGILVTLKDRSLTDIADELGYSSLQHFSLAFRKKYGVSPVKFR
ncbi:AraC-like DNA-binding protein [Chitinophaga skermanii]|uniref:AraC-like DNA-binding protein n=1 Tax=Chitinophaga skermanii TaxID=331697 RepID=A0A327Q969_9BACT|nr:AraC family transcriptional regulator [Chitinophaga skermanii]RAJ00358.1 AraC-like DNA-binding protein [Chitinophaga skermanii]